jgi:arylsulfatase A-like enzyme
MLADDLGFGDVGCFGQTKIKTVNIDRLALEGMRFTDCYAGSPVCAPSRCCLITGQHSGHARIRGNDTFPLLPEDPSLGKMMQAAGYRTAVFGKWGLGEADSTGIPNKQGFHEFYGYLNQVHAHDSFPTELWRNEKKEQLAGNVNNRKGVYSNDLFCQEALSFIECNRSNPFFLLWSHTIPHAFPARHTIEIPDIEPEYDRKPWPDIEKRYASAITRMDRYLGRVLQKLRELKIENDTLIIFTSDNGPQAVPPHSPDFFNSSGGLRGVKRDLYEGGIRVPTIVRWKGNIRDGVVCNLPWAFWDIYPTLAELCGQPVPQNMDGVSMLPAWLGCPVKTHPPFYWEFSERGFEQAARIGHWKAVRHNPGRKIELYDLSRDARESRDISDTNPKMVAEIERFLKTARTPSDRFLNG